MMCFYRTNDLAEGRVRSWTTNENLAKNFENFEILDRAESFRQSTRNFPNSEKYYRRPEQAKIDPQRDYSDGTASSRMSTVS